MSGGICATSSCTVPPLPFGCPPLQVGVGGGVLIVPAIVSSCKTIPQRCALLGGLQSARQPPCSPPLVGRAAAAPHRTCERPLPCRLVSGTSLAAVVSTAIASAYTYSSQGCVDLGAAALISPAAMLTAPLGARLTARLNCTALRRILGYFLLAAAPLVPLKASFRLQSGWHGQHGCGPARCRPCVAQAAGSVFGQALQRARSLST